GTRGGIAFVPEERLDASRFIEERQLAGRNRLDEIRQVFGVVPGLLGGSRQQGALSFGFRDSDRFAIHEQEIIALARLKWCLAQCDAASSGGIELTVILNDPAARHELRVDLLTGELFWSQVRHWGGACLSMLWFWGASCARVGSLEQTG